MLHLKPEGGFQIIYADPPWSYADRGCSGAAEAHYSTMKFADIAALPVADICAPDAVLFLWATFPKIDEALALIPRWGFTYKTIAFSWLKVYPSGKPFFGLGRWTRGNVEPCLLAVRGKPRRVSASVSQVVVHEVTRHSEKPPVVREKIVELMGDTPRIELFARSAAPGWRAWGAEAPWQPEDVLL